MPNSINCKFPANGRLCSRFAQSIGAAATAFNLLITLSPSPHVMGAPESSFYDDFGGSGPIVRLETVESSVIEGFLTAIDGANANLISTNDADGLNRAHKFAFGSLSAIDVTTAPRGGIPIGPAAVSELNGQGRACVCYLDNGGWISGKLTGGGARAIQLDMGFASPVTVSLDTLSAVRFATTPDSASEAETQSRILKREPGRDLLIVPKGANPVVLPGALEALGPEGWEFRLPTRVQKSGLDRAYAVVFGLAARQHAPTPATVYLVRGDRFSVDQITSIHHKVTLKSAIFGEMNIDWASIARVEFHSNRITWLADAKFKSQAVKSALGVDWTPRANLNVTGGPIKLGGRTFARGIGVHGATSVSYDLDGKQSRLQATIGIDDAVGRRGSVIFRVIGDGRELFKSETLRGGGKPVNISVDITGVKLLELSSDAADGLDLGDHADWADVRLIRAAPGGVS